MATAQYAGTTLLECERAVEKSFCRASLVPEVNSPKLPASNPAMETPAVKFDAAFLDRRMAEHRAWQEEETRRLCNEMLDEVGVTIPYRVRVTRPLDFGERA